MLRAMHVGVCAAFGALSVTTRLLAQTHAIPVNDWEPADTTSSWFVLQSEATERTTSAFAGLTGQYLHRPVVVYDSNWNEVADLVARQSFLHLALGMHAAERLLFNISVPILVESRGQSIAMGGDEYVAPTGTGVGDMRFEVYLRTLRLSSGALEMLIGARLWLPTGNTYQLTSDGGVRVAPQVSLAGHTDLWKYAVRVAYVHGFMSNQFAGESWDSRIQAAIAAGFQFLDNRFVVGPEVFASTGTGEALLKQVTTRAEALLGCHYNVDDWRIGLGWGVGLTSGVGVPDIRAVLSVGSMIFQAKPPGVEGAVAQSE